MLRLDICLAAVLHRSTQLESASWAAYSCRSLGELGDTSFKLPIVFLAAPSADEAVPRLPEVQEVVVHLRRGLR